MIRLIIEIEDECCPMHMVKLLNGMEDLAARAGFSIYDQRIEVDEAEYRAISSTCDRTKA